MEVVGLLSEISIGTYPAWITVLGIIFISIFMWKGQAGPAISYLQEANRVLRREVEELQKKDKEKDREISDLRQKTDVSLALKPLLELFDRHEIEVAARHERSVLAMEMVVNSLRNHETAESLRNEKLFSIMEMIAERLGPDSNGH